MNEKFSRAPGARYYSQARTSSRVPQVWPQRSSFPPEFPPIFKTPVAKTTWKNCGSRRRHAGSGEPFALYVDVNSRSAAVFLATIVLTLNGCGTRRARNDEPVPTAPVVQGSPAVEPTPERPETDLDRTIRVQLDKSFSDDPSLKDRDITFSIQGGDVTLTGTVRTETERRKANLVTMNVPGVKSVANALRVSL
jgi:BON domain-containing protein